MGSKKDETVLMAGVGGAGMRGLAYLLAQRGAKVYGSDERYTFIRDDKDMCELDKLVDESRAVDLISEVDRLVYTDAMSADHPVRVAGAKAGVRQMPYHEALGELTGDYKTIAVTGTHGKTSTTAMLGHILIEAGLDPTVVVGAQGSQVPMLEGRNARLGGGDLMLVEADEYRDHFLALDASHAIVVSIDFDHPDYFESLDDVLHSYAKFLERVSGSVVVLEEVVDEYSDLPWGDDIIQVEETELVGASLLLPGRHMQANATLAVAMAQQVGVDRKTAIDALATFAGVGRRFEDIGNIGGMKVISDYGHHPREIAATIQGAKERFDMSKMAVIFETHTLERLKEFEDEFAEALIHVPRVVLAPVFVPTGREESERVEAARRLESLREKLSQAGVKASILPDYDELKPTLLDVSNEYEVILAFTAGVLHDNLRRVLG